MISSHVHTTGGRLLAMNGQHVVIWIWRLASDMICDTLSGSGQCVVNCSVVIWCVASGVCACVHMNSKQQYRNNGHIFCLGCKLTGIHVDVASGWGCWGMRVDGGWDGWGDSEGMGNE